MTDAADPKPPMSEAKIEQKRRRAAQARELLGRLCERFPNCFASERQNIRPLAIGTQQALRAALADDPDFQDTPGWQLRQALAIYTRSPAYLQALADKRPRIDLQGLQVGEVSDEEQAHARQRLEEVRARRAARRPGKPRRRPQQRRESQEEKTQRKLEQLAAKFSKS